MNSGCTLLWISISGCSSCMKLWKASLFTHWKVPLMYLPNGWTSSPCLNTSKNKEFADSWDLIYPLEISTASWCELRFASLNIREPTPSMWVIPLQLSEDLLCNSPPFPYICSTLIQLFDYLLLERTYPFQLPFQLICFAPEMKTDVRKLALCCQLASLGL